MPAINDLPIFEKYRANRGTIAISESDYEKHGCPFCNHQHGSSYLYGGNTAPVTCKNQDCKKSFLVVADHLDQSTIGFGEKGSVIINYGRLQDDPFKKMGVLYPWVLPHPRPNQEAWVHQDPGPNEDGSENFFSRGIGYDSGACCFVTGQELPHGGPNIAGFVGFKESGERVVAMFGDMGGAWLDYREHSPTHIQVKILCHPSRQDCLERLHQLVQEAGNKITADMVEEARMWRRP